MSKTTVVFSTNQVVVEGGKHWTDSEGNPAYPETTSGGDIFEINQKLQERLKGIKGRLTVVRAQRDQARKVSEAHQTLREHYTEQALKARAERDDLQAQVDQMTAYLTSIGFMEEFKNEGPWFLETEGETVTHSEQTEENIQDEIHMGSPTPAEFKKGHVIGIPYEPCPKCGYKVDDLVSQLQHNRTCTEQSEIGAQGGCEASLLEGLGDNDSWSGPDKETK